MLTVAEKLKTVISQRGITYSAISRATGVPVNSISRSFLGKRKMTADEMIKICTFLNLDLNDFSESA